MPGALWWRLCARPAMACHPDSTSQTELHNVLIVGPCQWAHGRGGSGTCFVHLSWTQARSYLIWVHEGPGAFTHHLGIRWQQTVAVVQSSRRHLLEHRLAGRHCVATVVADGGGGGDLTGALTVTYWEKERHKHIQSVTHSWLLCLMTTPLIYRTEIAASAAFLATPPSL